MQVSVVNMAGDEVKTIDLPEELFEANVNVGLMHQALVRQLANARVGTHKTKTRGEVARTTAKIYRQKGTGNARHGSRRAPIFVGGGTVFGPTPRDYSKKMPRKMRRAALRSALTQKAQSGNLIVVDEFALDQAKTKAMAAAVTRLVGDASAVVVIPGENTNVERAARNLTDVKSLRALYLNIRDLIGHEKMILSLDALDVLVDFLTPSPVFVAEGEE